MTKSPFDPLLRVTRRLPCPICNHDHWCMISAFGDRCVCCRVPSKRLAPAFEGWFHRIPPLQRPVPADSQRHGRPANQHEVRDFGSLLSHHIGRFTPALRQRAAEALGLDASVFDTYPIGFNTACNAIAIPAMQLGSPEFVGIRYRRLEPRPGAMKWTCETGSTAGLLLPRATPPEDQPIFLLEGPSDTLAASSIGLHAVGRWSCGLDARQAGTLKLHAAALRDPTVVVVGDNDGTRATGARGADNAARMVVQFIPDARVVRIQPPPDIKDMRAWVLRGAGADEVIGQVLEVSHES